MEHTPYGYRIENGKAVIDERAAEQIRLMYRFYLDGAGLCNAAEKAGISVLHSGAARMLCNTHYLGDEYYPALIDPETFERAKQERQWRAEALGRVKKPQKREAAEVPFAFHMKPSEKELDDPYRQAEYLYSLIESEG